MKRVSWDVLQGIETTSPAEGGTPWGPRGRLKVIQRWFTRHGLHVCQSHVMRPWAIFILKTYTCRGYSIGCGSDGWASCALLQALQTTKDLWWNLWKSNAEFQMLNKPTSFLILRSFIFTHENIGQLWTMMSVLSDSLHGRYINYLLLILSSFSSSHVVSS